MTIAHMSIELRNSLKNWTVRMWVLQRIQIIFFKYTAHVSGGDQRSLPTPTPVQSTPAKCVDVGLILWFH